MKRPWIKRILLSETSHLDWSFPDPNSFIGRFSGFHGTLDHGSSTGVPEWVMKLEPT